jgi:hypothetical protein
MGTNSGLLLTLLASVATFLSTISAASSMLSSMTVIHVAGNPIYIGNAAMSWFGLATLTLCWTSAFYIYKRKHFRLAISGPVIIAVSCFVEYFFSANSPPPEVPTVNLTIFIVFGQFLFCLASIGLIAKSRKSFS